MNKQTQTTLYHGPYTPISASGRVEWDAGQPCDVLVNLTPHPLVVVGLPGPEDERARAALARADQLRRERPGKYGPVKTIAGTDVQSGGALVVPSHGAIRLRETPQLSGAVNLTGWVPDCLAGYEATPVAYSEPEGDLPPALAGGEQYRLPLEPAAPGLWPRTQGAPVWFVVSLLTAVALADQRRDVLTTGPELRDESGRILGCVGLRRVVG